MLSDPGYADNTSENLERTDGDVSLDLPTWEPGSLDYALMSVSRRALRYEHQIQDLEAKLTLDLSNFRAIENLLQEVFAGLQQTQRRADVALSSTVPHISHTLDDDLLTLQELDKHLPKILQQVRHIKRVYDHGREKAQHLINALEWINTPISLRLRTIIFTPNAPVSARWKALVRAAFALVFLVCIWIAWITLRGAVRAHRQRLVWGERLMS